MNSQSWIRRTNPSRNWELDATGQPTQDISPSRRRADFITPIPKPRKRKGAAGDQVSLTFDEGLPKSWLGSGYPFDSDGWA